MIIYQSGIAVYTNFAQHCLPRGIRFHLLESYHYFHSRRHRVDDYRENGMVKSFFLDSGAFSAFTQNKPIDIQKYIAFIKERPWIDFYAGLDDISSPERTMENQKIMEDAGLKPIPTFHYSEPWRFLDALLERYDYIALGGMVPIPTVKLIPWLNQCFGRICDREGNPKVKVHGFGIGTIKLIAPYPWESVDSTTAIAYGGKTGKIICESGQEIELGKIGREPLPADKMYIKERGYDINEMRVSTNYRERVAFNIETMNMWEKRLTENPPKFINYQTELL